MCIRDSSYKVMVAMEVSFPEHVCAWKDSKIGARPQGYKEYKEERVRSIVQRLKETFPEYKDTLKVVDSASMLTFRDYLNSPYGSAYGIKPVSYTHLRAHETVLDLVCRLLL